MLQSSNETKTDGVKATNKNPCPVAKLDPRAWRRQRRDASPGWRMGEPSLWEAAPGNAEEPTNFGLEEEKLSFQTRPG